MALRLRHCGWLVSMLALCACYQQPGVVIHPTSYASETLLPPTRTPIRPSATPMPTETPTSVLPTSVPERLTATLVPATQRTPMPLNPDGFPARPASLMAYPDTIVHFLQQAPTNEARLDRVLQYWRSLERLLPDYPTYSIYHDDGLQLTRVDLDRDGETELVVVLDGGVRDHAPGLVVVFQRDLNGQYTATTHVLGNASATPYGSHIVTVHDLNQTPASEIVIRSNSAGACTSFITVTVLNWHRSGFRVLLETTLNGAVMTIGAANANGIQPITLNGGGSSCYAPIRRTHTEHYLWNGNVYTLATSFPDPITARHPYFKLMDGNDLAEAGAYRQAIRLYEAALAEPYPWDDPKQVWPYHGQDMLLRAIIRFRLLVSQTYLGNTERAKQVVDTSVQLDGVYADWFTTFWQSYNTDRTIARACQLAMTAARGNEEEIWRIPGYTVKDSSYDPSILCPTRYWS